MSILRSEKWYPWLVWGLAAGFFFAEYFARVSPSVMVPQLMRSLNVGAFSLGALSSFFYYAYVAMQLPVGALFDRFGPRRLLSIMAIVCGLAAVSFAFSNSLPIAILSRFFMGFAAAFAFVGALKLAHMHFPARRFGFLSGITQALGMLGAAVGEGPVSVMVVHIGWRASMLVIAAVLIVLGLAIAVVVRQTRHSKSIKKHSQPIMSSFILVMKRRQTWVNGIVVGFLYAPTAAFAALWGVEYLRHVRHLSVEMAASMISLIFIGFAISSPIAGWLSDHIGRRKPIILASILGSGVLMSIILYWPSLPIVVLFVLLFLYGAFNVGVATAYAVAAESNVPKVSGTAMAFANMASVIIGALFQPIIGALLDWHAIAVLPGHTIYTVHDFKTAMLILPAAFVISLIAWFALKETFKR